MSSTSRPAAPDTAYAPGEMRYTLHRGGDPVFFDAEGRGVVEILFAVGKGAPMDLYDESSKVKIGAILYCNTGTAEAPVKGEVIGEFRGEADAFTIQKARTVAIPIVVQLPVDDPAAMLLEVDLVKEHHFWFRQLGHPTLLVPIARHYMIAAQPDLTTHDLSRMKRAQIDRVQREKRYEAIIFSLLNHLEKSRDPQP